MSSGDNQVCVANLEVVIRIISVTDRSVTWQKVAAELSVFKVEFESSS